MKLAKTLLPVIGRFCARKKQLQVRQQPSQACQTCIRLTDYLVTAMWQNGMPLIWSASTDLAVEAIAP